MSNISYSKAYTQVLTLLQNLPEEEYVKIPKNELEFLEKNRDVNYVFTLDSSKSLAEQNISIQANSIIVRLFTNYFATDSQKMALKIALKSNLQKVELEKRQKYNPDNIFKKTAN